jgi:Tfp pilus assembly protein PilF
MEAMPTAKASALKALEIDNTLAEAYTALAYVKLNYDWDWPGAEREFRRAVDLSPNYPTAHHWYAWYLAAMERYKESAEEVKRAQELDPLSLVINTDVGWISYYGRQYDQGIEHLQKTLEMDPNFSRARLRLGLIYLRKRMYKEAMTELKKAVELSGNSAETVAFLGHAYAASGEKGAARQVLNGLKGPPEGGYVSPYYLAIIYIALEDKDQALAWLERAYEKRSGWLAYLKVEPMFDSLRSDRRFTDLLRRIGLSA